MITEPKDLGLPDGYEYDGPYTLPHNPRAVWVTVRRKRQGAERAVDLFRVWFTGLIPFQPPCFPDQAMIERIDASTFEDDPAAAVAWAELACELYGSLPVRLQTWDAELSFFQGRWVDCATGEPVVVAELV